MKTKCADEVAEFMQVEAANGRKEADHGSLLLIVFRIPQALQPHDSLIAFTSAPFLLSLILLPKEVPAMMQPSSIIRRGRKPGKVMGCCKDSFWRLQPEADIVFVGFRFERIY